VKSSEYKHALSKKENNTSFTVGRSPPDRSRITMTLINERMKYGGSSKYYLDRPRGETSSTSMVPNSFSRVIVTEVIKAQIRIRISVITLNKHEMTFQSGLQNILTSGRISRLPEARSIALLKSEIIAVM
jgi:hypothetical protein